MLHWIQNSATWVHATCNSWCLQFSETAAVWFTGWATLFAVLVSLRLARRQDALIKIAAQLRKRAAGPRLTYWGAEKVLAITATNVGGRPTTVVAISWQPSFFRRMLINQSFGAPGSSGPPRVIDPGTEFTFTVPANGRFDWGNFAIRLLGKRPRIAVHWVRIVAYTAGGQRCSSSLPAGVKKFLVEKAEAAAKIEFGD